MGYEGICTPEELSKSVREAVGLPPKRHETLGELVAAVSVERETPRLEEGKILHFCRCPHCREEFGKNPEHFVARLAG